MKTFFKSVALLLMALAVTTVDAQTPSNKDLKKEFKTTQSALKRRAKALEDEIKSNAVRDARKEAKALEKEGFSAASGALPLEKQLEQSWKYQYETDADGYPIYIVSTQTTIGGNYNAAKSQASAQCKVDIAGLISTEVMSLIESQVSNEMISPEEAVSLNSSIQASKLKIQQSLGRTIPVMEIQRKKPNGNIEVRMTLAYNTLKALEEAKAIMKSDLKSKGSEKLAEELDNMFF